MKLAWQQIPSPVISEILCNVGLDGVVIDTEHGFFNNETLFACIQVISLSKKLCYVRITEPNKSLARACLDSGVDGLIFSTVNRPIDCDRIHEMCKYPRHGGKRGLGLVRQNKWGAKELVSAPPKIIAQIETIEGVSNIDIISTYDFDYYMIGPYDLFDVFYSRQLNDYLELNLTVQNIFDEVHKEMIGGAKMGRQLIMRLSASL